MAGMRANLSASLQMRMRSDPISRAQDRDDVPVSTALELLLREALTGEPAPQGTESGLSLVREWITGDAGADLTAQSMMPDDQARKSVVSGKSVSVRVDLGGSRVIKKKTQKR